jgi:outer membrane protein OmpA-like peptidoglycan-associated protein
MKKLVLLVTIMLFGINTFSQTPTLLRRQFNTWSLGGNFTLNQGSTDVKDNKTILNNFPSGTGFGLSLSKQMSHFLGFSFNYNNGNITTNYNDAKFKTPYQQVDGRIKLSSVNGQVLSNYRNTSLYAYMGLGMINYSVESDGEVVKPKDWVGVIPVGVGGKIKLSDKSSLNVDFGYNFVNTDRFENKNVIYTNNDGFYTANVGIQYNLGSKSKKTLEWDKPFDYYKPSQEHSVDTVVVINRNIDTLYLKFTPDETTAALLDALNKAEQEENNGSNKTVNFDFNKWKIKATYFEYLDKLALDLIKGKIKNIVLDGYSDPIGKEMDNVYVSQQRAESVKNYLVSKGVDVKKITIRYYGSQNPVSTDNTQNRRVEFKTK